MGQEDWQGKPYGMFRTENGKANFKLCEQDYSKAREIIAKLDGIGKDVNNHVNFIPTLANSNSHIFALAWSPGVYARAYDKGGTQLGQAFAPAPDLATGLTGTTDTKVFHLRGTNATPQIAPGPNAFSGAIMIWKRALSIPELNLVGDYLAGIYAMSWEAIPI